MNGSPTRSVPFCTRTVAVMPLPLSSCASTIVPVARRSGLAFRSSTSASRPIFSSSTSTFFPVFAESSTHWYLPPHSSTRMFFSASCWRIRSGLASGLSILLIAMMIGTRGGLRVADRLERLRHDAVVGRDDEHDDVGDLCAAGAHGREGLVARRVEERDHRVRLRRRDFVRADVLRDPARFAGHDVRAADVVEERRLAVVDVSHDGDDRRAALQSLRGDPPAPRAPLPPSLPR